MDTEEYLFRSFPDSRKNVDASKARGTLVKHCVDATELHVHGGGEKYDVILWNFPHIKGKQNIRWNRELLVKFLSSARCALQNNGLMKVSLCKGQSGLDAGNIDEWNKSWKLTAAGIVTNIQLPKLV